MKITDKDLNDALARQAPAAQPRPADVFWTDFRSRARSRPRDTVEEQQRRPVLFWAAPLACAALLLVAVGLFTFSATPAAPGAAIKSYEVVASHSAVFIMQDEKTECTVMWVADLEPGPADGDSI